MNSEFETYELIDSYLRKELKGKELEDFNQRLSVDPDFSALVEAQRTANEIIIDDQLLVLKEKIHTDLSGMKKDGWKWWASGLLGLILITSSIVFIYNKKELEEKSTATRTVEQSEKEYKNSDMETKLSENKPANPKTIPLGIKTDTSKKNASKQVAQDTIVRQVEKVINAEEKKQTSIIEESKKTAIPADTEKFIPAPFKRITNARDYKSLCEGVIITCTPKVTPTCEYEAKGSITIDPENIKGGIGPYYFSFENEKYTNENTFTYLSRGTYTFKIKDEKGCISSDITVEVTEKKCEEIINDVFAPTRNETWKYPIENNTNGEIRIYNKAGMLVYSATIANGNPSEWDGKGINGNELETGYYLFILQLNNGGQKQGHVTIMR